MASWTFVNAPSDNTDRALEVLNLRASRPDDGRPRKISLKRAKGTKPFPPRPKNRTGPSSEPADIGRMVSLPPLDDDLAQDGPHFAQLRQRRRAEFVTDHDNYRSAQIRGRVISSDTLVPAEVVIDLEESVDTGISMDRWPIESIVDRREVRGLIEYLVEWESTALPRQAIRMDSSEDHEIVLVDGRPWPISSYSPVSSGAHATAPETVLVQWPQEWRSVWELPISTIIEYERPRVQQHQPSHLRPRYFMIDEDALGSDQASNIDVSDCPELQAHLEAYRANSEQSSNHSRPQYVRQFNMPLRRLLDKTGPKMPFPDDDDHSSWRAKQRLRCSFVHVTGQESRIPCTTCQASGGSFTKCVVEGTNFNGACTSCAYTGDSTKCSLHHNEREYEPTLRREKWSMQPIILSSIPNIETEIAESSAVIGADDAESTCADPTDDILRQSDGRCLSSKNHIRPSRKKDYIECALDSFVMGQDISGNAETHRMTVERGKRRRLSSPISSMEKDRNTTMDSPYDKMSSGKVRRRSSRHAPWKTISPAPSSASASDRSNGDDSQSEDGVCRSWLSEQHPAAHAENIVKSSYTTSKMMPTPPRTPRFAISDRHPECRSLPAKNSCLRQSCADLSDDEDDEPLSIVHSDRTFAVGEATSAEIRFVLSRCSCANIEIFDREWRQWKRELGFHKMPRRDFISLYMHKALNAAVKQLCPSRRAPGFTSGEVIDLTDY